MEARGGRTGWVKLFSSAVIDQALLSAANFLVGLLLIRHSSDEDYGHYVLGFSALILLTGAQGAYIGGPLAVLAPRQSADRRQRMLATLYHQSGRWIRRVALVIAVLCAALGLLALLTPLQAIMGAVFCATAATALEREYLRNALMIYERPQSALGADTVYVLFLVGAAAVAALFTQPAAPWMFAGMALASLAGAVLSRRSLAARPGLGGEELPGLWREIAPLGVWAMAGCIIQWSFSQGYNYVAALSLDLSAVAALNATRLLLMPVILMVSGIKSLLLPMSARWYSQHGLDSMLRRLLLFSVAVLAMTLVYYLVLWLSRDWLTTVVLHKQLPQRDAMLKLWMILFLVGGTRDLLMTGLLVRERFKDMVWLTSISAVLALSGCWLGLRQYGAAGAILGLVLGEVASLLGVLLLIVRERRRAVQT